MSTTSHDVRTDDSEARRPRTAAAERERKQRILTHGTPSITTSIADAVVIKDENLFFLTEPSGNVPLSEGHGFGLYYHDCRYLRGYDLRIADAAPTVLASTAAEGDAASYQLANPDFRMPDGRLIPKETVGIKWARTVRATPPELHDVLTFENFGLQDVAFPVSLSFDAKFEDIFAVRGLFREKLGKLRPPEWSTRALRLAYDGKDGRERVLTVTFTTPPESHDDCSARFQVTVPSGRTARLEIALRIAESPEDAPSSSHPQSPREPLPSPDRPPSPQSPSSPSRSSPPRPDRAPPPHAAPLPLPPSHRNSDRGEHDSSPWTSIHSDSLLLNEIASRALGDLHMLRSSIDGQEFFAAGIPWFSTLFGRDSIVTALQSLAYEPRIAEHTARLLAHFQGHCTDEWRDEQPGKILHSLRVGEMARLGEIPHTPYYGSVDATPLFLILIGRHAAWTGDLTLFNDLHENIELALHWMSTDADSNGDGYIEYASTSERGLINQGWKDSGDAIVDADGRLATPPIALVEVQGYAYLARSLMADLYERTGNASRAGELRRDAAALRERFNRDFWLPTKNFYALALEARDTPLAVISSNPGHALWSGIADEDKARHVVERLLQPDMYNGWGIRTLSAQERRYNPVGYHLGTVWPHDNSMIAVGFRRYGFDEQAKQVLSGLAEAAMHFTNYRMPELMAGFSRAEYSQPVRYPVACHPQAWAAGSIPYLLETVLGLVPEAFDHRLRIVRPMLPTFADRLEMRNLRVGDARAALRFERTQEGNTAVTVLETQGPLEVLVEPGAPEHASDTPSK